MTLYAVIKRGSKYYCGQQTLDSRKQPVPFSVQVTWSEGHCVRGNGNQYRVADLNFLVRLDDGQFVRLGR